jgi:hypothetical protein
LPDSLERFREELTLLDIRRIISPIFVTVLNLRRAIINFSVAVVVSW